MNKYRATYLPTIFLTFILLLGCKEEPKTSPQATGDEFFETVSWIEVEERPMQEYLLLSGDIVANEQLVSRVVTPISGKLSNITTEAGDI